MLLRSGIIVAVFTLLSRIFGMFRELFIAATFGTGPNADAVNVAFKLPNLFRRIFGEGALSSVFVPMFTERLHHSNELAEKFASKVFISLTIVLTILSAVMQYFMPELMIILAPGFNASKEKFDLTVLLCRITMPYLIFISLVALVGGMLNSIGRFAAFAGTPVIMSSVVILGTYLFERATPSTHAIAWAVILAGVLQLFFMVISLYKNGLRLRASLPSKNDRDIKKLLKLMLPATISNGIAQLSLFVSQSIASFIPGAVSILSYADRIYQVPMSIIGTTFGTILLPTLSRLYEAGDFENAKKTQDEAVKIGLLLSFPCAMAIIVLAVPIIKLIYQHGVFTAYDTVRTADAIAAYSIGLPAFILSKIFMPIFYANQDAKTPMKITVKTIIANIILNIIFMYPLSHVGISLGTSLAAWYNVYLFVRYARIHGYFHYSRALVSSSAKILLSSMISGAFTWLVYGRFVAFLSQDTVALQAVSVLSSIGLGFCAYIGLAIAFGVLDKGVFKRLRVI